MRGFIQMLNSKVRNTTELEFGNSEKESAFKSGKITDAWRVDSDHEHADWPRAERVGRFLASISGRAILGNMCALSGELRNELDLKRTDPLLMFATVNPRIVS